MQAGACSGIAQQIPNDNTMIAITGKTTAPSAWMATAPACGESELLGYLKGCNAIKDKRDQNLLELDRHISLVYAQGEPDRYTDRMEMTHLAVLFSMTAEVEKRLTDQDVRIFLSFMSHTYQRLQEYARSGAASVGHLQGNQRG
jgi:hypothetical protein